jgi:hypothetical protein
MKIFGHGPCAPFACRLVLFNVGYCRACPLLVKRGMLTCQLQKESLYICTLILNSMDSLSLFHIQLESHQVCQFIALIDIIFLKFLFT